MTYAVIQKELIDLKAFEYCDIYTSCLNIPRIDAMQRLKTCCKGVLAENLRKDTALKFQNELFKSGVDTFLLDIKLLLPNPKASTVNNADPTAIGFEIKHLAGKKHLIPWNTFRLLTLGEVTETKNRRTRTVSPFFTHRISRHGEINPPNVVYQNKVIKEKNFILDIYVTKTSPHLRIKSKTFNYDYLKERVEPSSDANFQLLIMDIVSFCNGLCALDSAINTAVSGNWSTIPTYASFQKWSNHNYWKLQTIKKH